MPAKSNLLRRTLRPKHWLMWKVKVVQGDCPNKLKNTLNGLSYLTIFLQHFCKKSYSMKWNPCNDVLQFSVFRIWELKPIIFMLDLVGNVLVLVSFVISWTWCSPYFGLSVLRNKLVLVGFPFRVTRGRLNFNSCGFLWHVLAILALQKLYDGKEKS